MADSVATRRLAAIVALDVAGYSRLIESDEEGTIAALRAHRGELTDPKIAEYRGRIANTAGDSILSEFPSVVDALRCAMEIQHAMSARNREVPEARRIEFRVGIHVGDVLDQGGDLLGDGVNLAARLETFANPGEICISARVWDDVRDRLEVSFEDLGEHRLKNIARPVRIYRVLTHGGQSRVARAPASTSSDRWPVIAAIIGILLVVVPIGGSLWLWQPWREQPRSGDASEPFVGSPNESGTTAITEMDEIMVALRPSYIRAGPGTEYGKVGVLSLGQEISVTGKVADGNWYRVALVGGIEGYVFAPLLQEKLDYEATLRQKTDEDAKLAAEEKRLVDEEAQRKAAEEAQRNAAEAVAQRKAEAQRKAAEAEAQRKADEARRLAEAEAQRKAEAETQRKAAEAEAQRKADEARRLAEAEAQRAAERAGQRDSTSPVQTAMTTPAFPVDESSGTLVALRKSNVRAGPGTEYEKLTLLDVGQEVTLTGRVKDRDWYRVKLANVGEGYVAAGLVEDKAVYAAKLAQQAEADAKRKAAEEEAERKAAEEEAERKAAEEVAPQKADAGRRAAEQAAAKTDETRQARLETQPATVLRPPATAKVDARAECEAGNTALQREAYDEVDGHLTACIEAATLSDYNRVAAHFNRAIARYQLGKLDGAVADFSAALKIQPALPAAYLYRAQVYQRLGKADLARSDSEKGSKMQSEAAALLNSGKADLGNGLLEEAVRKFTQAIALDATVPDTFVARGGAYDKLSKVELARADFQRAKELGGDDPIIDAKLRELRTGSQ